MLKLIIEDDEGRKTVVPFVRDEITIGRQEGNTIRLTERNVSRRHARLLRQNGHVLVEDLGSYNGIRINGDRIQGQVSVNDGDLIQIGDYDLAVQREETASTSAQTMPLSPVGAPAAAVPAPAAAAPDADEPTHPRSGTNGAAPRVTDASATLPHLPQVDSASATATAADDEPAEANPDDVQPAPPEDPVAKRQSTAIIRPEQLEGSAREVVELESSEAPRLVVLNTEFAGREYACIRTELRIGRTDDNDIAIDHRSLSRTHCKVVREGNGEWRVIDMQSANGLMVNGEPYAQSALRSGDTIELGHVKLRFLAAGEAFTPERGADDAATQGSALPKVAIALTLLVLLAGGAYALFFRPAVKPPPPPPDPAGLGPTIEKQAAEREALLDKADGLIDELKWDEARALLLTCKVDGSTCPKAVGKMASLDAEAGMRDALIKAEQLLSQDKLEEAKQQLDSAASTTLLHKHYQDLSSRVADASARKLLQPKAVVDPTPKPVTPKVDPVEQLTQDARTLISAKSYAAAKDKLESCIKLDPKAARCHKLLGTCYAKLNDPVNGAKHYKRYTELASPDDPDLPKVKQLLEQFQR
ncbi:MAG: FHA domain-containing protein [Myxococcaceae bacterium]|nr:FHA domain-containing protein [Myxococcaceae bacterium]